MRILIVEDEEILGRGLAELLEHNAYAVDLARDGEEARRMMAAHTYDLVVLDWSIPPPDGIELLRLWRSEGRHLPILMLTGRTGVEDRVSGLDHGADDYLTKPFSFDELLARVRSLLRRRHQVLHLPLTAGDLTLRRPGREVRVAGERVDLSPKEFAVLEYLLTRRDEVVSREEIRQHVWGDDEEGASNVIDVVIYRLRKKIDGDREDRLLHTIRGAGYTLRSSRG